MNILSVESSCDETAVAIVRDGRGWVDMVTVAADTGDASCRLRAVRLVPQTISSKEGS